MAVIPWEVYSKVEWHLHNRAKLLEIAVNKARRIEADAINGSGGACIDHGTPRGVSKHADPTAIRAMTIIRGEKELEKARLWSFAADSTFAYFDGTIIGEAATRYYGQNTTILAVAESLSVDRQTIRNYRDKFVCVCALFASEKGLIHLNGKAGKNMNDKASDKLPCRKKDWYAKEINPRN